MGGRGATVARRPPPPPAAALVLALLLASACSGPALAQDSPLVAGAPAAGPLPPAPAPAPAPAPVWAGTGAGGGSATGEEYSVQENPGGLPWALLFSDEFQGDSLDLKK